MSRSVRSLITSLVLVLVACSASDNVPASNLPMTVLDQNATQLRDDFNRAKGTVRLLFLVDPACSVCLRGLADMNDALLKDVSDARLQTFIVHTSVIGGESDDVAPAAALLSNAHVHHYWDPTGNFGRHVSASLGLKHGADIVYAWDVWMIYDGEALLPMQGVTQPVLFMHQLPKLRGQTGRPFFDSEVFAAKARELLTRLPPAK